MVLDHNFRFAIAIFLRETVEMNWESAYLDGPLRNSTTIIQTKFEIEVLNNWSRLKLIHPRV